jgi:Kef-type K+ transport system membrane component KefB
MVNVDAASFLTIVVVAALAALAAGLLARRLVVPVVVLELLLGSAPARWASSARSC